MEWILIIALFISQVFLALGGMHLGRQIKEMERLVDALLISASNSKARLTVLEPTVDRLAGRGKWRVE